MFARAFQRLGSTFRKFEKEITVLANIATSISAIAAVVALAGLAYQIYDARKSVEAQLVYSLQKDGREIIENVRKNAEVFEYIFRHADRKTYEARVVADAEFEMMKIIQFYSSLFNQRRNGVISDRYWQSFSREIESFIRRQPVAVFWDARIRNSDFSEEFRAFGNAFLDKP
jgi:hypothetical protein